MKREEESYGPLRAKLIRLSAMVLGCTLMCLTVLYGIVLQTEGIGWVALISGCGMFAIALIPAGRLPAHVHGGLLIGNGVLAVFAASFFNGGVVGSSLFWLLCVPILCFEIMERRPALILVVATGMGLLAWSGRQMGGFFVPAQLSGGLRVGAGVLDTVGLFLILTALSFFRARETYGLKDLLAMTNRRLTRLVQVLTHDMANSVAVIEQAQSVMRNKLRELGEAGHTLEPGERAAQLDRVQQKLDMLGYHVKNLNSLLVKTRQIALWQSGSRWQMREFKLAEALEPVLENLRYRMEKKQITVVWEPSLGDTVVWGDDVLLVHQGLANFLSNAIKFTPPGGKIYVFAVRDGDHELLAIEDSGSGVPLSVLEELSGAGNRVQSGQGTEGETGTGFGLLIATELLADAGMKCQIYNKAQTPLPPLLAERCHSPQGTLVVICLAARDPSVASTDLPLAG